ncbi:FtsX-like permease family protein [Collinsella tanakaei]|uniref:FtsX-like permease family protein n=1 Tax=Collinsella tanakaei TaxID=626935 RepID=UPI0025A43997|nr:FtsX-like permease family protein [Collinsella tanakaei]MDM8300799.1 FtsX-like permease family protein [Collinsella tanakaei]
MASAYRSDIARTVRNNLKRFVSIAVICALGVAMFCGLRASCQDLRDAADAFFDEQNLFDVQVLSTLGLDDDDLAALSGVEGVQEVEGGWSESTYTDVEGARATVEVKALSERGFNEPYVVEGTLPERAGEVAVTQKFVDASGLKIGDTVEIAEAEDEEEAVFERRPYTITAIVIDAADVSNPELSFRSSSSSDYTFLVTADDAISDAYTVAYVAVADTDGLACYSEDYERRVAAVTDIIEDEIRADREQARTAAVKGEAQAELDDARAEYEEERADAEAELADGKAELDDAAAQLADAKVELENGLRELVDAWAQIVSGQREIDDGWDELEAGEAEIADGRAQLAAGQEELDGQRANAEAGFASAQAKIDENRATLAAGREQLEAGEAELEANEEAVAEGEREAVEEINDMVSEIPDAPADEVSTAEEAYEAIEPYASMVFEARDAVTAAQQKVDELQASYDAIEGARTELQAEKDELEQATIPELTETIGTLETRKAELETALGEDASANEEYLQLLEDLGKAQEQLAAAQTRLQTVTEELAAKTEEAEQAEGELEEAKVELTRATQTYATIKGMMAMFGVTVEDLETAVDGLTELIECKTALAQGREELEASRAELEAGEAQLEAGQAQLDATRSQVRATLASAQADIDRGYAELEAGAAGLPAARQTLIDAQAEIDRGIAEYEDGMASYHEGVAEYEDGLAEYEDGLAEWEEGRAEADEQFAEAEAELADAQAEIDDIDTATWYVQTRSSNSSYSSVESDADSIEAIGTLFPIVFLVVAVLVSLTTITRLVEEERGLIGTYKALGYHNSEIYAKYLVYALAACIVGCAFGLFLGFIALPAFIFIIFDIMYLLPGYAFAFDPVYGLGGMAIFVVAIGGTAYLACRSEVRRTPAELMRPKAPKSGSRIFLERIPAIWHRLSFLNKVTARNLFRYKRRFFMTVAGILGCTALIVCGFAIKDSVAELVPEQYERIARYDIMAVTEAGEHDAAARDLAADSRVDDFIRIYIDSTTLGYGDAEETVQLIVVPDDTDLSSYINVSDCDSDEPIELPVSGAIVTQNAAEVLGFDAGATVELQDSQLNGATPTIAAVARNFLGNYLYMSESAYLEAFGDRAAALDDDEDFEPNGVLIRCTEGNETSLADELSDDTRFLSVTSTSELADDFSQSFMLINAVVAIVLGMAAALAFAVLFTLSTTNISERERELATIKVLGFRPREVHHYVNKETIILTLIGIVCGLPFGYVLGDMLLHVLKMPQISFLTTVTPLSYVLAAILPLVFALIVNLITNRTLNRIDMIEALKSVE